MTNELWGNKYFNIYLFLLLCIFYSNWIYFPVAIPVCNSFIVSINRYALRWWNIAEFVFICFNSQSVKLRIVSQLRAHYMSSIKQSSISIGSALPKMNSLKCTVQRTRVVIDAALLPEDHIRLSDFPRVFKNCDRVAFSFEDEWSSQNCNFFEYRKFEIAVSILSATVHYSRCKKYE